MAQQRFKSNALPGLMLVIIVFWALSAVLMLTGTLGAANRINERVKHITADVTPIASELTTVPILNNVKKTAADILVAATPLSPKLAKVQEDVDSIDGNAKTILQSASEINGKVHTIHDSAFEINGTVTKSIGPSIFTIKDTANEINGTVHTINGTFVGIDNDVVRIQKNLVLTSKQVDRLNQQVAQLKSDTTTISPIVDQINGNAMRIRASPVVLNPANAAVMHQTIAASQMAPPGVAGVPNLGNLLPQLQGLNLGPLPVVPLVGPLPVLGLPLLDLPLLNDTGSLLSLVGGGR